jgi:hypothetical protein
MWLLLLEIGDSILRSICLEYTWKNAASTLDDPPRAREDQVRNCSGEYVLLHRKGREVTWPMLKFSLVLNMVSGLIIWIICTAQGK